jgi:peroxiredoxin
VGLVLSTLLLQACTDTGASNADQPETLVAQYAARVDYLAPDFQLASFPNETPVKLSDFSGKPILINFWATTCEPCQDEMPRLATAYHTNQSKGLIILGVDTSESSTAIKKYLAGTNFDWTMLMDKEAKLIDSYGVAGYPTSFFIDRQGFIRAIQLGILDQTKLDQKLAKILN